MNLIYMAHLRDKFGDKTGGIIAGQLHKHTKTKHKMVLLRNDNNCKDNVIGYEIDECIEAAKHLINEKRTREIERWKEFLKFAENLKQNYYLGYKVLPRNDPSIEWGTKIYYGTKEDRIRRVKRKKRKQFAFIKKWNKIILKGIR